MADRNRKVIGYFAFASPTEVVCTGKTGDACVISGSVRAMKTFVTEIDPDGQKKRTIKKTSLSFLLIDISVNTFRLSPFESEQNFSAITVG
jgi:hypothetical protein